ncbi:hypothetical protein M9H77_26474 [Catharanthus roseus]|uniref:Uncharacterized protein n=1 Tax=Catharanthus roseus TaxID=4058 RepID=A0ACC0AAS9_CATRO|nr:hypothetical protein M9H77_26474 [Catharanthus roseus]
MLPIQFVDIEAFWRTLEIDGFHPSSQEKDVDMDYEMRALTDLFHEISTRFISKVREMSHLMKGVLSPVLPEDPGMKLTSSPEVAIMKGRKKTTKQKKTSSIESTCQLLIKRYKSQAVLVRVLALDLGRVRVLVRVPVGEKDHHELLGVVVEDVAVDENLIGDENCGYRVMTDFVFGDEHQWLEVRRQMIFELERTTNMYISLFGSAECVYELICRTHWQNGPAPLDHWLETPDSLYVITNIFNLCVIFIARHGSTTVLPLYSYSDRPGGEHPWKWELHSVIEHHVGAFQDSVSSGECGRETKPCNRLDDERVVQQGHWSMSPSIDVKEPPATMPR